VNDQPLHLAAVGNPAGSKFPGFAYHGVIRQFGIWNRVLSPAEIRAAMNTGIQVLEKRAAGVLAARRRGSAPPRSSTRPS
jgi:hypothetical protein